MDSQSGSDAAASRGVKASVKHMEFQLQREKTTVRDLEEKVKHQQEQIAKLEQSKAELRRSLVGLEDDERKKAKWEERYHASQKELADKSSQLAAEQKRAAAAEAERDQVRRDAHASIAKWRDAEQEWLNENTSLQTTISDLTKKAEELVTSRNETNSAKEDMARRLQYERERYSKLEALMSNGEKEMREQLAKMDQLQSEVYARDETITKLEESASKWQNVCGSREDELRRVRSELARTNELAEDLQGTISTLNQRLEASAVKLMDATASGDQTSHRLQDAQTQIKQLQLQVAALQKENEFSTSAYTKQQETISDLRSKLLAAQEDSQAKTLECMHQEDDVNRVVADLKQRERELADARFEQAQISTELQETRGVVAQLKDSLESVKDERDELVGEVQAMKTQQLQLIERHNTEKYECEVVEEQLRKEISELRSQISSRQETIALMTAQLDQANRSNMNMQRSAMADSSSLVTTKAELSALHSLFHVAQQQSFVHECDLRRTQLELHACNEFVDYATRAHSVVRRALDISVSESKARQRKIEALKEEVARLDRDLHEQTAAFHSKEKALLECGNASAEEKNALQSRLEEQERLLRELRTELQARESNVHCLSERVQSLEMQNQELSDNVELAGRQGTFVHSEMLWLRHADVLENAFIHAALALFAESTTAVTCNTIHITTSRRLVTVSTEYEERLRESDQAIALLQREVSDRESEMRAVKESREEEQRHWSQELRECKSRVAVLHTQNERLDREIVSLQQRLTLATERSRAALAGSDAADTKQKNTLKELTESYEHAQQKCASLTKKLTYEIQRKEEYKRALDDVKALRQESERNRAIEKELATTAINSANKELLYWVNCFETLKSIIESNRHNGEGGTTSSSDLAKLRKFEEAHRKVGLPLTTQTQNTVDSLPVKRKRTDDAHEGNVREVN